MHSVFLIEDHSLVREGFSRLIAHCAKFEVVGAAASLEQALSRVVELRPELITMDLGLPGLSGPNAVCNLLEACPWVRVVVVSARVEPPEVQSLVELGVVGYVTKEAESTELIKALEAAARGEMYLTQVASKALATAVRLRTAPKSRILSPRLLEVLGLTSQGKTTQEIGEQLFLSPRTVEKYRGEILKRLECRNQIEALQRARDLGLLQ